MVHLGIVRKSARWEERKEGRGRGRGCVGGIWSGGPSGFHKDRVGVNHSPGEGD